MHDTFRTLEKFGRIRLSQHFYLRQFLYSEIAAGFGLTNLPDNVDLAVETGTRLCHEILEPIVDRFGPIIVRSGFRSSAVNQFGATHRLNCAPNERNYAYHIWDHLDESGYKGAAACIIVPGFTDGALDDAGWPKIARRIHDALNYHRMTFFARDGAFNIGWHECPKREIYSTRPKPHWVHRDKRVD